MRGFVIVILGSLCLASQNVLLRVIFSESAILGQIQWGGLIPATPANSLLILQMRSLLILPAMALLAYRLYPATGETLGRLLRPTKRTLLGQALAGSSLLFVALGLLFTAIASIPAGVATVLFFIHPAITGMISWRVFGQRPTPLRGVVTLGVLLGSVLVVPYYTSPSGNLTSGVAAALGASVAYSLQGVLAQLCFREIHPVPYTLINFAVMVVLASLGLLLVQIQVPAGTWGLLWGISAVAALLTLLGQLFYNIGIHLVRASSMAIVEVTNPVFTVMIAWGLLQESLQPRQLLGVGIVVASILALGWEQRQSAANGG